MDLASQLFDGTGSAVDTFGQPYGGMGSAVGTFGQPYGGMSAPVGSSYGGDFEIFTTPPVTTVAEREIVESVADSESDNEWESDSDPDPEIRQEINKGKGKTVEPESPRPKRAKKPGEKQKSLWTGGGLSRFFSRKDKGKK